MDLDEILRILGILHLCPQYTFMEQSLGTMGTSSPPVLYMNIKHTLSDFSKVLP
jgi:hypothetical protein